MRIEVKVSISITMYSNIVIQKLSFLESLSISKPNVVNPNEIRKITKIVIFFIFLIIELRLFKRVRYKYIIDECKFMFDPVIVFADSQRY